MGFSSAFPLPFARVSSMAEAIRRRKAQQENERVTLADKKVRECFTIVLISRIHSNLHAWTLNKRIFKLVCRRVWQLEGKERKLRVIQLSYLLLSHPDPCAHPIRQNRETVGRLYSHRHLNLQSEPCKKELNQPP
jgi:hypothetical protein